MNGQVKLFLSIIVLTNIANCENNRLFKHVNSSMDQESKSKGGLNPLEGNFDRARMGFNEPFGNNMEPQSVLLRKQFEGPEFNSRQNNNYNDNGGEIYRPNLEPPVFWGNQPKNIEHNFQKNSDFNENGNDRMNNYFNGSGNDRRNNDLNEYENDRRISLFNGNVNDRKINEFNGNGNANGNDKNADEPWRGPNWDIERDSGFAREPFNPFDYRKIRPNVMTETQIRPKPDWENFEERQTVPLGDRKQFTDFYSNVRNPQIYVRREYLAEPNNREMKNQNIYVDKDLVSIQSRYPFHRIFDFNDENENFQRSNFYKSDKGLVINLKTECPKENRHNIFHKIFFSSEPHLSPFSESSVFPTASFIPSSPITNPLYYS